MISLKLLRRRELAAARQRRYREKHRERINAARRANYDPAARSARWRWEKYGEDL
jgi:hypothetical protein